MVEGHNTISRGVGMFNKKPSPTAFPLKTISGIFTAALLAFTSLNFPAAENRNKAYRDVLGRPAICKNHTKNVKMSDIVSDKQCDEFLSQDLFEAINGIIIETPTIVENKNALRAAVEFTMNTNIDIYKTSPMNHFFKERDYEEGCRAFDGFMVYVKFKQDRMQYECHPQQDGTFLCKVGELEVLRREQMQICLGNL